MRLRWNTTAGMIVIVAGSAVALAVASATIAAFAGGRDNPLLGLGLVLASVGALTWLRFSGDFDRRVADGEHVSFWRRALLLLASLGFAILTIGLSGVTFLVVFGMVMGVD